MTPQRRCCVRSGACRFGGDAADRSADGAPAWRADAVCLGPSGDHLPVGVSRVWLMVEGERGCEECGSVLQVGVELLHGSAESVGVDWCPNLQCPSNAALRGFLRVGVRSYRCLVCDAVIEAYIDDVVTHRREHGSGSGPVN